MLIVLLSVTAEGILQLVIGFRLRAFFISCRLRLLTFNSFFLYIQITQKGVLIRFNECPARQLGLFAE